MFLLSYILIVFRYVKIFAKPEWVLILFILRCVIKCVGWLQWRHNESDGVSNHRRLHCLLNCWFRRRSKKTSKLRVTGLCAGNSPVAGEFLAQKASNAEIVSIWWRHHVYPKFARRTIAVDSSQRVTIDQERTRSKIYNHGVYYSNPTYHHWRHWKLSWCQICHHFNQHLKPRVVMLPFFVIGGTLGCQIDKPIVAFWHWLIVNYFCTTTGGKKSCKLQ